MSYESLEGYCFILPKYHLGKAQHLYHAMRNLITLNRGLIPISSQTAPDLPILTSTFDPLTNAITVVLGPGEFNTLEVQQFQRTGKSQVLAAFGISEDQGELLSFVHFEDESKCVFIFGNGDIYTASYEENGDYEETTIVECVGSIDPGLLAAQWSHDEETVVLVTKENSVLLLSRQFDSVGEMKLQASDAELSNHVDVGWGSKETQFKGKGARQAERDLIKNLDLERDMNKRDPTMPLYVDDGRLSEFDTKRDITISWRKDCEFFGLSAIELINDVERRIIRVFTRSGELVNVTEPVDGQEGQISWGNLITSVQRQVSNPEEDLTVIFFEKNGLRHGQFTSRLNPQEAQIASLEWNANNEALALQTSNNTVQIWTSKNYHWYLKQEITSLTPLTSYKWHQEKPLTLLLSTSTELQVVDLAYKTTTGPSVQGLDIGMNLVVDGTDVGLTPLAMANVPPPMFFREISVEQNVKDVAVSTGNDKFAVLDSDGLSLAEVDLALMNKKGQQPRVVSKLTNIEFCSEVEVARQVAFRSDTTVALLIDDLTQSKSHIVIVDVRDLKDPFVKDVIEAPMKVVFLKSSSDWSKIAFECIDGSVYVINETSEETLELEFVTKFASLCCDFELSTVSSATANEDQEVDEYEQPSTLWANNEKSSSSSKQYTAFGLSSTGKLYANETQLSTGISSIKLTESHLIITTAQHTMRFIHLEAAIKPLSDSTDTANDERIREIERGSLLVNIIPSKAAVVLQAPRGNLETINPRILILATVRNDIKEKNYKAAFVTCRTHRIDLDLLYDYDPVLFANSVELFVNQIEKVEYLDLFVSCLHEEDVTKTKYVETKSDEESDALVLKHQAEKQKQQQQKCTPKGGNWIDPKDSKVNKICELILSVLLTEPYCEKYLQTIITAYACEKPANLEAALTLISQLSDQITKEKAVVHLCFLQDVNLLYKVSLGLYDIKLTLAIAQQSQKDPKEYLPFLQNLFDQTELRRKFLIDDFLGKHEKALIHLVQIVSGEITEELKSYVVKHELYKAALSQYKGENKQQNVMLCLFAKFLYSKQNYSESGLTYELLGMNTEALESYISGQRWREAFSILTKIPEQSQEQLQEVCDRLITALNEAHQYSSVARIQFQYLKDLPSALTSFCKEYQYEEAILLATSENKLELIEEIIIPGISSGFATVAELIADCKGQITSQLRRLRELRTKKTEDPYAFFGNGEDVADDVSIAPSETSTKESFFTRYTGKTSGTAKTGASRRTVKNKKREERKRARGKKGTIYEEEYLIRSIGRLIERLTQTKPEALRLIEALIRVDKREQAREIQSNFVVISEELKACVGEVFDISEKDRERVDEYGEVYYIPEIERPLVPEFEKLQVLDY